MPNTNHHFKILTDTTDSLLVDAWKAFLPDADHATHYVTPDYFTDPFVGVGKRFAVLVLSGARVDAVLTGLLRGRSVASGLAVRPQTAFRAGIDRSEAAKLLIDGINTFAGIPKELITIHSWEILDSLADQGFEHESAFGADKVIVLDLAKGPEQLFKEFSERRRTELRKTMRQQLVDTKILETEEELVQLYQVHVDWNQRKGNSPDDYEEFRCVLGSEYRSILIARNEGMVIAGTYLRYCSGGVVEYAANNSLEEFRKLRPNELLGWKAIEWACENNFRKFSMGASHPFLARFGGTLTATHRYRLDRTFLRRHANRERFSRLAIATYQSLPKPIREKVKSSLG